MSQYQFLVFPCSSLQTVQELPWQGACCLSWHSVSLSNSISSRHISCLPLFSWYSNTDLCTVCWSIFFGSSHYHFPPGPALIWYTLHGQMPFASSWSKHRILHFFQEVLYYSQHPNCIPSSFSFSKFKLFSKYFLNKLFSKYFLNFIFKPSCILTTIFAACAMRLTMQCSLHFVACGFLVKQWNPWASLHFHVCVSSLRPSSPSSLSTSPGIS
jgi:hypothetical protein